MKMKIEDQMKRNTLTNEKKLKWKEVKINEHKKEKKSEGMKRIEKKKENMERNEKWKVVKMKWKEKHQQMERK